jgi:zinc protease
MMRSMLVRALALLASSACGLAAAASPGPARIPGADSVHRTTLANGMTLIVWPDRDIPNVAFYNWVRVGSRNEAPGITGLAHFFEHMMFNGTSRRAPGEFDREMEARGGSNNAFTSDDVTVYQNWFPREALEPVFDLEGDRLANLAFDPKVIESERGVVFSERRLRVEDSNAGFLSEQMQATAFIAHPYQFPTIGWPSDIRGWRIEDLQQFFRTYYAPNNCTVVVVGDVSVDEVLALARRFLEPIPRQAPPPEVRTREPEQPGERRLRVERRAQTPLVQVAYKSPAGSDPRIEAIGLLGIILAQGDASRLHRALVEQQKVAIDVGTYVQEGFDPGLMWFVATLPAGADPARFETAFDAEIARVVREGVTPAELARARNLFEAALWRQFATIDGKARLLGEYEVMLGDHRRAFEIPERVAAVTTADIHAVAREILDARRRTVGVLVPAAAAAASSEEGA